jgi:hypothetical protein
MGQQLQILTEPEIQVNREKYQSMVGKEVTLNVTGKIVKGTVRYFNEDTHCFYLSIDHEPVNWGGAMQAQAQPFARKIDDWGSLNNVNLI